MNLWHASTELQTTATAADAKAVYLAAGLEAGYALGLGLGLAAQVDCQVVELEVPLSELSGKSDTSG
ncbi:MAG TPA: hypothetical protein VGE74_21520 [Gemmata sp.]